VLISLICTVEKIGSIFFLSGFGGSLFAEMFLEHRVSAGASTPLFGLLGAWLSDLIINWSIYDMKVRSLQWITKLHNFHLQ
jgi:membrane associated rhomboid family serine protease